MAEIVYEENAGGKADTNKRIKEKYEKYQKRLLENYYGLDDVAVGAITKEQYDSQQGQLRELKNDYKTAAYRIWIEIIPQCTESTQNIDAAPCCQPGEGKSAEHGG